MKVVIASIMVLFSMNAAAQSADELSCKLLKSTGAEQPLKVLQVINLPIKYGRTDISVHEEDLDLMFVIVPGATQDYSVITAEMRKSGIESSTQLQLMKGDILHLQRLKLPSGERYILKCKF